MNTAAERSEADSRPRVLLRRPWPARPRLYWSIATLATAILVGTGLALRPDSPALGAPIAPSFKLPVISGGHGSLSLRSMRGHTIVLNFFQSDCGPCLDEMQTLERTARTYAERGVIVVGVSSLGDPANAARRLSAADHLTFPVVSDSAQSAAWQYGVSATPTTMFIDGQGRARGQYVGQLDVELVRDGLAQAGAIACQSCAPVEQPTLGAAQTAADSGSSLRAATVFGRPFTAAPPFALRDQRGQLLTLASMRGKVVALTFLSAVCTEQCPLIGQTLSAARRLLGPDAARLSVVAISVAPEQDNHWATVRFARKSGWEGTDWHYLTALRAALVPVWKRYGVYVEAPPPIFQSTGTQLVHQAGLYLIDRSGRLRAYYDVPFLGSDVAASVRALLGPAAAS